MPKKYLFFFALPNNFHTFAGKMANDYFSFRQFTIRQEHCAMKVGTDGTLLGAWANGGRHILDIGTGTGLISLMMAQRFADATVTGIDIDEAAVGQAQQNVAESPFADRIAIIQQDVAQMEGTFDAIVSNPPFFSRSLHSPDSQRSLARHDDTLPYSLLTTSAWRLLTDKGELSLVIPYDQKQRLESEAALTGFFKSREWTVRTSPRKTPKRVLLAYRKHPVTQIDTNELTIGTEQYIELTKEFHL